MNNFIRKNYNGATMLDVLIFYCSIVLAYIYYYQSKQEKQ